MTVYQCFWCVEGDNTRSKSRHTFISLGSYVEHLKQVHHSKAMDEQAMTPPKNNNNDSVESFRDNLVL